MPPRTHIPRATATAVFAAAVARGQWTATDGTLTTVVGFDGYGWTVTLPAPGTWRGRAARAVITQRHGLADIDRINARATAQQTAALHTHAPAPVPSIAEHGDGRS